MIENGGAVAATSSLPALVGIAGFGADRNRRLSREEFARLASERRSFPRWDTDGDDWADAGEFVPGLRGAWRTEGPDVPEDDWLEPEVWFPEDLVERHVFQDWDRALGAGHRRSCSPNRSSAQGAGPREERGQ